jgi:hypothetical protein
MGHGRSAVIVGGFTRTGQRDWLFCRPLFGAWTRRTNMNQLEQLQGQYVYRKVAFMRAPGLNHRILRRSIMVEGVGQAHEAGLKLVIVPCLGRKSAVIAVGLTVRRGSVCRVFLFR